MKKIETPTPKDLVKAFKETFVQFGFSETPITIRTDPFPIIAEENISRNVYDWDGHLEDLASICLKHGMKNEYHILRIMEGTIKWGTFGLLDDDIRPIESIEFLKDLATLASIFKNGRSIKIQATMPDGDFKEKHITLDIETNGLLQKLAFLSFNSFLALYGFMYDYQGVAEKPNDLNQGTLKKYQLTESGTFFKEPYSDKELADIIEFETGELDFAKAIKGRTKIEIPKLGYIAHCLIKDGGIELASMKPTEKYCLIFDLMEAAGIIPTEEELKDRVLKNKDKADMVKSWEASGLKVFKGCYIFH